MSEFLLFRAPRRIARPVVLATLAAGLVAPAMASGAPYEPNDSLGQAVGPMVGGQAYAATIENSTDSDWFYFNVVGQRQLDVALSMTAEVTNDDIDFQIYDADGSSVGRGNSVSYAGATAHIAFTAPSAGQYAVSVQQGAGNQYSLRVDPADALIQTDPGLVATLKATDEPDDIQRILVDGKLIGETRSQSTQAFSLGVIPPTSQITFEAINQTGEWSWNAGLTNHVARGRTTVFTEQQSGGDADTPVVGAVRRVTLTPTGGVLSSCGLALAPVACDVPPPAPAPTAVPTPVTRKVTITRKPGRYRGRVAASARECYRGVRVELRRKGKGTRSYGSTITRQDGSWTLNRKKAPGKIYAFVAEAVVSSSSCSAAASPALRKH